MFVVVSGAPHCCPGDETEAVAVETNQRLRPPLEEVSILSPGAPAQPDVLSPPVLSTQCGPLAVQHCPHFKWDLMYEHYHGDAHTTLSCCLRLVETTETRHK